MVFPVEDVVQVGGYVVHQVTAAEALKTGDQVRLHLDQVNLTCHMMQRRGRVPQVSLTPPPPLSCTGCPAW